MVRRLVIMLVVLMVMVPVVHARPAVTPPAVVADFYRWYFDYVGTGDAFRSPLADRAYHDSDLLTKAFVKRIDALLASPGGLDYDPFLCAQDVPSYVYVAASPQVSAAAARLTVESDFADHHFDVLLAQAGGTWRIDDVVCGTG